MSLQGPTRLFLVMMDLFKYLGHQVWIVGRTKRATRWMNPEVQRALDRSPTWKRKLEDARGTKAKNRVFTDFCRLKKLRGGILTERLMTRHYNLNKLRKYHPLKYVHHTQDVTLAELPLMHPYHYMPEALLKAIPRMDLVFADTEIYLPLEKHIPGNYLFYVHWPPKSPRTGEASLKPAAPAKIWCNSEFTAREINRLWGPEWNPQVVYPPMWTSLYDGSPGFESRHFDVVMFSRLYEDKIKFLDELRGYKLAVVGSDYGYKIPSWVKLWKGVPWKTVVQVLSHSKVYVHCKGFGTLASGAPSTKEHFGQTITEAMACGCVPIVPEGGGPVEILGVQEELGFMYRSVEELTSRIDLLLQHPKLWTRMHRNAVKRVKAFDVKTVAEQVSRLLS